MTTQNPPNLVRRGTAELHEVWAANLDAEDVTLAPFMPVRAGALATGDAESWRLRELIARAQGKRRAIIL